MHGGERCWHDGNGFDGSDISAGHEVIVGGATVTPEVDVEEKVEEAFDKGWSVIVWDDPVNLMSYVVFVFKKVLGMNESEATKHMLEVHEKGKSAVAKDNKEKAEFLVHRLHGFGLHATMEQAK